MFKFLQENRLKPNVSRKLEISDQNPSKDTYERNPNQKIKREKRKCAQQKGENEMEEEERGQVSAPFLPLGLPSFPVKVNIDEAFLCTPHNISRHLWL